MGAGETLSPAGLFKIAGAGRVVRKKSLELGQGLRERKVGAVENVHGYSSLIRLTHTIYP
jgi:hypothetical protein